MLTTDQEHCLKILVERHFAKEPITIFTGIAGSGKDFTIKHLIGFLGYNSSQVAFCAFTGTAAKVMIDNGLNASTIHGLIYKPIFRQNKLVGFKKKPKDSLSHLRLIVVNEFSMLPQQLLDDLSSYGKPMILVGDKEQLPPIGKPNKYLHLSHANLTQPVRQALDNPIVELGEKLRRGESLSSGIFGNVFIGWKKDLNLDWVRPDVLVAAGSNAMRNKFNQQIAGSSTPLPSHKIIFLKNDWVNYLVNGSWGELTAVQSVGIGKYSISFISDGQYFENYLVDWQFPRNPKNQFIDFGFSLTVHKLQGRTISQNMLIWDESYLFGKDQNRWLYTALTRVAEGYKIAILR